MANIVLLAVCLLMGMFLRRTGRLPATTPAALNGYVIYVALPAAAIRYLHDLRLEPSLLLTALMAWLLFAEPITVLTVLGTVLTAIGVSLVVRSPR